MERGQGLRPVERLGHAGHLGQSDGPHRLHEARDLTRQALVHPRHLPGDDAHFLLEAREVDPEVEAPAPEGIGELADAVRGQDDVGRLRRLDGADLGDGDLELGEDLEQESLELLIGPVDLVDEEDGRRSRLADGLEEGALDEKGRREDGRLLLGQRMARALLELDVQELLRVVPLVQRLGGVETLVTLEPDQVGLQHLGHHLGDLGLAHARMPLDEERFLERHGEMHGHGNGGVRDVLRRLHHFLDLLDLGSHGSLSLPWIAGALEPLVVLRRVDVGRHGRRDVHDG